MKKDRAAAGVQGPGQEMGIDRDTAKTRDHGLDNQKGDLADGQIRVKDGEKIGKSHQKNGRSRQQK